MKFCQTFSLLVGLVLLVCIPAVSGVVTYLGANPEMSASVSGTNEFYPGDDATITVIVQNSGLADRKTVDVGTIARDDVPTTAKLVMVGLSAGNAPVIIKTDPQMIGDIPTATQNMVSFTAKILNNATDGEYQLPLSIGYTYYDPAKQEVADYLQIQYINKTVTVPITIRIKPEVNIEVIEAIPENLNIGGEGYLNLTIKNTGLEDGKKATVTIVRNGNSPIIPTDSNVFIGDFPKGGIVTSRYKVSVSNDAEKQTYPVDVKVTYENRDGEIITSSPDTVGVPVGGKSTFAISSSTPEVSQGSSKVIMVGYTNTGDTTIYHAQARIEAVDPFTSSDNTAYLGDLKPGETATANYQISSDSAAAIREYNLDTEVRYRDSLDNSQVSDTFKVPVRVVAPPASEGLMKMIPGLVILVLLGIGAGYYLLVMRKKK
jgi:hypothetical protein